MLSAKPLLCLAFSSIFASAAIADYAHREPISQTSEFRSNGELSLKNVNGTVEVRTWDRNEIRIEGEKSAETEEELQQIQLTMDVRPEAAEIEVKLPKREGWFRSNTIRARVNFVVTVPATAQLIGVSTVNGRVSIEGVHGRVRASAVNGGVRARNVSGDVNLSTVNGGVEAEFSAMDAGDRVEAEAVNGGVKLVLPAHVNASLNASTVNGGVKCDFPIKMDGSTGRRSLRGTIGSGGAKIKASTVNGGVRIEQS